MGLKELRERLKALASQYEEAQAALGDDPTEEDMASLQAISDEFDATKRKLEIAERAEGMKAELTGSAGRLVSAQPPASESPAETQSLHISGGERVIDQDPMRGFDSMAEFGHAVFRACTGVRSIDPRLMPTAGAASTFASQRVAADGGYAVPPQMVEEIFGLVYGTGSLLDASAPRTTMQSSVKIPSTDNYTPWGSSGVLAYWTEEGTSITASKPSMKQVTLDLHKLAVLIPASEEILEDAPRLQALLTQDAAQAIRWEADDAIINGDGNGKPLGIANAACLVSQAKESGQTASTIVAANVAKMWSRLLPGSHSRAVWVISPDAYPQVITMTLGDQPVWMPPVQGMQQTPNGLLFGRPIIVSFTCQTLGTEGDIYLADLEGGYAAYTKGGGIRFGQSMHLYFDADQAAFKWTFRLGGQPYLSSTVSPDNGSSTLSHFVSLATRS